MKTFLKKYFLLLFLGVTKLNCVKQEKVYKNFKPQHYEKDDYDHGIDRHSGDESTKCTNASI